MGANINGDADNKSDIDLLIILENCPKEKIAIKRKLIAKQMKIPMSWISIYTTDQFKKASKSGDYFLWSIKLYHKIYYSKTGFVEKTFKTMTYFCNVRRDILNDSMLVEQTMNSYFNNHISSAAALTSIAFYTRDLCKLICFMNGIIDFKKYTAEKNV